MRVWRHARSRLDEPHGPQTAVTTRTNGLATGMQTLARMYSDKTQVYSPHTWASPVWSTFPSPYIPAICLILSRCLPPEVLCPACGVPSERHTIFHKQQATQ